MAAYLLHHVLHNIYMIVHNLWENKKNPKYYGPVFTVFLAVSYTSGLLQLLISWILFTLIILLSIISGLAIVLCRGSHRQPPAPRPTTEQQNLTQFMQKMTTNFNKHFYTSRLVISKDLDKSIQEVIDLIIRDFCLSWFHNVGEDETAFVEILNKEFWTIIENLRERLRTVDTLNFLCNDLIEILYKHCHDLKLSDAGKYPGQTTPFLLHPCLKEKNSEIKYVRTIAEALILCLLPNGDTQCAAMRYILREVVAGSLFLPTAESVCDPDYINQTLVYYLEDKVKITGSQKQKQKYAYAETYEDFIKLINTTTDIETLKQLRYHTIAEIMQATVIHNTKDHLSEKDGDGSKDGSKKQSKKDALRDRNLKKYINQCRVSKQQCEKRIRNLGGPDYRYYGLGHGQPLQGTEKRNKQKKPKSIAILAFNDIMDNSLARSFFYAYLQKQSTGNLLSFWIAIEKLRLLKQSDLQSSAANIFQEYVTPSSPTVIKLESRLVRGMEDFVNGIGERDSFYEAQKIVYDIMESRYYPEFVISPDYTKFVCQSESALDDIRAHITDDQYLDISAIDMGGEGFGFKERRKAEELKEAMPSNIEERNDYAVRSLQALDHNINAKTQALDLIKRSHPVDIQEKERIETQLEQLSTERRHLEFHIERTDLWCERLGYWKANISSGQYHPENKQPVFVICVSCDEDTDENREASTHTTGWVVCRQLNDFKALHNKLKECCSWMSKELPVSSKKWYKKYGSESLESLKVSLQEYLTIILGDDRLSKSDHIYTFLIPSPEHLRGETSTSKEDISQTEKKNPMTFISNIKDSLHNLTFPDILADIADADEVEEVGIEEESVHYKKDSIAQPMYTLIGEVFELKGVFKVLRKTLITFVQVSFGGTINRHLREFVSWLASEQMLLYYIDNFKQSWWPKGKLAPYTRERTDLEKLRTREQAKERMMKSIPDVLVNLVGRRNSNVGFLKLFEAAQDIRTNKHFFYVFLELVVTTICPEIKSPEVYIKADQLYQSKRKSTLSEPSANPT